MKSGMWFFQIHNKISQSTISKLRFGFVNFLHMRNHNLSLVFVTVLKIIFQNIKVIVYHATKQKGSLIMLKDSFFKESNLICIPFDGFFSFFSWKRFFDFMLTHDICSICLPFFEIIFKYISFENSWVNEIC